MSFVRIATFVLLSISALSACHQAAPEPRLTAAAPPVKDAVLETLAAKYQNQFPDDSGLWAEPAIASRLQALLGSKYHTFFGCLDYNSPARVRDGVLYVTGSNFRDRTYAAVFAMKLSTGAVYVRLRERGRDSDYPQSGSPFALPAPVRRFAEHWSLWPESLALAAQHPAVPDQSVAREAPPPSHGRQSLNH